MAFRIDPALPAGPPVSWPDRIVLDCLRWWTLVLVCCAVTPLALADDSPSGPGEALIKKALPAVVTLKMLDRQGADAGEGTGFFIRADGQLVTARHVSEAARELVAVTADGQRRAVTGFYGDDRDFDIAILQIEGDGYPVLPLATVVRTNQWVGLATPELRGGPAFPTGTVARVLEFGEVLKHILTTVPVKKGHSGSPMLNAEGEVIGVLFGSGAVEESFVAPVEVIRDILAQPGSAHPIPFAKRPRRGNLPVVKDPEFKAGAQAMERKNWTEANRRFRGVVRRFPDSPTANLLLGISYRELKSWANAKGALAKAVQHKPQSAVAWLLYGNTLLALEQFADGAAALQEALNLGLTDWNQHLAAWSDLAAAHAQLGDGAKAQAALDRLAKLDARRATRLRTQLEQRYPAVQWPPQKE
jgi:S1-C subfamily serine protease